MSSEHNPPADGRQRCEAAPVGITVIEHLAALADHALEGVQNFDNTRRAIAAVEAVWLFAGRAGLNRQEEAETAIADLLCNLMHLCRQTGITDEGRPFSSLLETAGHNYSDELAFDF
ncbi:hypothetical protein OMR58_22435 [Erwinia sp. INIA-01]|uniref:hypothetical protein n=1 Tax=Erwinia sp. INIA01 TaxID=2991500 RepID=UPI002224E297|nr:hypothetical protein [Erwinia sp. INIA01]MCW1877210.1 hypothetical protein [Erwinia sp. INIA01]